MKIRISSKILRKKIRIRKRSETRKVQKNKEKKILRKEK